MTLPSGTVTFLFTDIEGSTKQWDAYAEQMSAALRRHDVLMHQAIESNGGVVFKTIGDAFCAAFSTASNALYAALTAQRALQEEPWPEPIHIRVRMALHTGAAEERDGDYFGPTLNRVARLLSLGHGGQILLAEITTDLLQDALPDLVSLKAMGEHRLRDLSRAEHVFQLLCPSLPSEFPPLKSLTYFPNNLPSQLTSFIGRAGQITDVKNLLQRGRLLTLTGSGGCGKTRLALQVAAEVVEDYPDGVWLVELGALTDAALLPQEVGAVLDVKEQAGQMIQQTLTAALKAKNMLLLLDNCEHLTSAVAQMAGSLLRSCQNMKILATSRDLLGIAGEQSYRVPSLSLPDLNEPLSREDAFQYEAIRLFVERARLVKPDFEINNQNALVLARVCHRLDGIPLALELAAARVRSLALEEIHTRLDNRFRLLTGGDRTALPRQQTLRSLIDWSYDLLNTQEKLLLSRLSVFAGGWTLAAAEQVCADEGSGTLFPDEVLDLLTSLVDKSLVITEEQDGSARYRMMETVRAYAAEKLAEDGEVEAVRTLHRKYFHALIRDAKLTGPDARVWLARLELEHDNLRAALMRCAEETNEAQTGLQMVGGLWFFWNLRGYFSEGRAHLAQALERDGAQERTAARASALYGSGALTWHQGDYARARSLVEEALGIQRELGNKQGMANVLNFLGIIALFQGEYEQARARYEESLQLERELGNEQGVAIMLINLSQVAQEYGDYTQARSHQEAGLAIFRRVGDRRLIAMALQSLGAMALRQGDRSQARSAYSEALEFSRALGDRRNIGESLYHLGLAEDDLKTQRSLFDQALVIRREHGDRQGIAMSLNSLGLLARVEGDYVTACSLCGEALSMQRDLGRSRYLAQSLESMATISLLCGNFHKACCLMGAAESLRVNIGASLYPHDREEYDQWVEQARSALGGDRFAVVLEEGRAMDWEKAVEYALETATAY